MCRDGSFVPAAQKGQPAVHAAPGLCRDTQNFDARAHGVEISGGCVPIELHGIGEIDLRHHRGIGA